jgi:hypothetical protein
VSWLVHYQFADGTEDVRVVEGLTAAARRGEPVTHDVLKRLIPPYKSSSAVVGVLPRNAIRAANMLKGMPLEQRVAIFNRRVASPPAHMTKEL